MENDEEVMEEEFTWYRGPTASSRLVDERLITPLCPFCGTPTTLIRKLFCRSCGYFEGCCDGGKQALEGEYDL